MSFAINKSHFREPGMSFRISEASAPRTHFRSRNVVGNRRHEAVANPISKLLSD